MFCYYFLIAILLLFCCSISCDNEYLVGASISDITGLVGGVPMSAYVNPRQIADGIHMRLRSRGNLNDITSIYNY